jgi:hypothetical protein
VTSSPSGFAASFRLCCASGLYNGFLVAGIVYGVAADDVTIQSLFLACVVVAGVFGGLTVAGRIAVVQSTPALIAFVSVQFGYKDASQWTGQNPVLCTLYMLIGTAAAALFGLFIRMREAQLLVSNGPLLTGPEANAAAAAAAAPRG